MNICIKQSKPISSFFPPDSKYGVTLDCSVAITPSVTVHLRDLDVSYVRVYIFREWVETADGVYDWTNLDTTITNLKNAKVNAYITLCGSSGNWYGDPTAGNAVAIADFSDWCGRVCTRYKDYVKYWEIWNEPDYGGSWPSPSATNYTTLLISVNTTLKGIDSTCKIILGGIMGWGGTSEVFPFLDDLYTAGAYNYIDIFAFHPYCLDKSPLWNDVLYAKLWDYEPDNVSQKDGWLKANGGTVSKAVEADTDCIELGTRFRITTSATAVDNYLDYYQDAATQKWVDHVSNTTGWEIEARLKVVSGSGIVFGIRFADGAYLDYFYLTTAWVGLSSAGDLYVMDTTDAYHIYKIITLGSNLKVYVDGTLRINTTLNVPDAFSWIQWGDFITDANNGGVTYIDYLRYNVGSTVTGLLYDKVTDFIGRLTSHGENTKKIWITEFGYPSNIVTNPTSWFGVTEVEQNQYLEEFLDFIDDYTRIEKIFIYKLLNSGTGITDDENFGLMTSANVAKSSYTTYKNFIRDN